MAQFPIDFAHGEMDKRRPAIVVSTKAEARRQKCATVVPISSTAPHDLGAQHVILPAIAMPIGLRDGHVRYAKCDCVNTLSLERLDLIAGPRVGGRRSYVAGQVSFALLLAVRRAVAGVLGIHEKTFATSIVKGMRVEKVPSLESAEDL